MLSSIAHPLMNYRYPGLVILMIFSLTGCLGGGSNNDVSSESVAWLRIDSPADGYTTSLAQIEVSGNAAVRDASVYPSGAVYWSNNANSGVVYSQVVCFLVCLIAFQDSIPLSFGENNIRLQFIDGVDTVTVFRVPKVSLEGRVTDQAMVGVPGVKIELKDVVTSTILRWVSTDSLGNYQFPYTSPGDYQITPVLPAPQGSGCLGFTPDSITLNVSDASDSNIYGLDFSSTQDAACYSVSGSITPPPLPLERIKIILEDQIGNQYLYWTYDGSYTFYHLPPGGPYTITPEGTSFIPSFINVTIIDSNITGQDFIR